MTKASEVGDRYWVALSPACRMLEVNQATLRRWADRGFIHSYRTPGGHRRFFQGDLRALMEGTRSAGDPGAGHDMTEAALRHIRRRLRSRSIIRQPWYKQIQDQSRRRMRLFGHRLLTLVTDYLSRQGRGPELVAEARLVGEEYGTEVARLGLPLGDATQAFVFFRNSLIDGLKEFNGFDVAPREVYLAWQQVNTITDAVLLALIHAYQRAGSGLATGQQQ